MQLHLRPVTLFAVLLDSEELTVQLPAMCKYTLYLVLVDTNSLFLVQHRVL